MRQIRGVTDDQGNVTSVAYDLFGRRTAINSPDAGSTTITCDLADKVKMPNGIIFIVRFPERI
jgi:YD repeat-containing protein